MNKIIEELLKKGVPVEMIHNKDTDKTEFVLDGFYKSGEIRLIEKEEKLYAHARYNEVTEINSLFDLVNLNYDWWKYSEDRFDGWINPDPTWLPLLLEFGLVKEETKTITTYL